MTLRVHFTRLRPFSTSLVRSWVPLYLAMCHIAVYVRGIGINHFHDEARPCPLASIAMDLLDSVEMWRKRLISILQKSVLDFVRDQTRSRSSSTLSGTHAKRSATMQRPRLSWIKAMDKVNTVHIDCWGRICVPDSTGTCALMFFAPARVKHFVFGTRMVKCGTIAFSRLRSCSM